MNGPRALISAAHILLMVSTISLYASLGLLPVVFLTVFLNALKSYGLRAM